MPTIASKCCEFTVGMLPAKRGYCYVCGSVHQHDHLDLRHLRREILVRVGERHRINWDELRRDSEKLSLSAKGVFCQTLLHELAALCPHEEQLYHQNEPLNVMACWLGGSIKEGLDFTTDLCSRSRTEGNASVPPDLEGVAAIAENAAEEFKQGQVLRYDPNNVSYVGV